MRPSNNLENKINTSKENHYKVILSYNLDGQAKELYFDFVKTPSLMRHSMEHKMILRNETR